MTRAATVALLAFACTSLARAQSFNIDIGPEGSVGLPASYAAAGGAGHWLSIPATQGVTYWNLVDVDGEVTTARVKQIGGTETLDVEDEVVTGDDALLMNDYLATYSSIENCLFFNGLEPGTYDVIIYARMPAQPDILSRTNVDEEPGHPYHVVGGTWPEGHEEFVTYARHRADVGADGVLGTHSGVPPGDPLAQGAALNGIQIALLEPIPGDVNGDDEVDIADLLAVLSAWGPCSGCPEDIDADGMVGVGDLLVVLAHWGT